jgi:hypothetical protein
MKWVPVLTGLALPATVLLTGCGAASPRAAVSPPTSGAASFVMPPSTASRDQVVTAFLNAVVAHRCADARRLLVSPPAPQDGIPTYCDTTGPVIDGWRDLVPGPGHPDTATDVAAELHFVRDETGGPVPAWELRFFALTRTTEGWRISGGGTGP